LVDRYEIEPIAVDLTLENLRNEPQIIANFEAEFQKHSQIKAFIINHMPVMLPIVFPVAELVNLAKKHNAISIVDGAHCVGQIPINISKIDPDFYFSTCHKWLFAPRGSSFLYTNP
jgi:selenocysteine lyase/cysteine desulfurase